MSPKKDVPSKFVQARESEADRIAVTQASQVIAAELWSLGIDQNSPAGREFRLRAQAFGVMGVQPPRPELGTKAQREE